MSTNFSAIDSQRKNGNIDASEAASWVGHNAKLVQEFKQSFSSEMPQIRTDNGTNYYTEEFTPEHFKKRIASLKADQIAMQTIKWRFE